MAKTTREVPAWIWTTMRIVGIGGYIALFVLAVLGISVSKSLIALTTAMLFGPDVAHGGIKLMVTKDDDDKEE